jgi:hypothetical protein
VRILCPNLLSWIDSCKSGIANDSVFVHSSVLQAKRWWNQQLDLSKTLVHGYLDLDGVVVGVSNCEYARSHTHCRYGQGSLFPTSSDSRC